MDIPRGGLMMDIQVKIYDHEPQTPNLEKDLKKFLNEYGYEWYGFGYDLVDNYREIVFDNKQKNSGKEK